MRSRNGWSVPSLIAYWDTLGWVYFARGDLAKAEKYVSAAWLLGEHGEVGDHLAQIYEKRGRKDRAIDTYAMAMSGIRPTLETRGRLAALVGGLVALFFALRLGADAEVLDEHLRRGHGETCSDENDRRRDPDTPTQRPAPVRSSEACVAGPLPAESRAPSRAAGARG